TAPGCAVTGPVRRSLAASRAIRADRRRRRRARVARRPDRTAPPHIAQPGRTRLLPRKPMESCPQSARRQEDGRDKLVALGDLGRNSALGATQPREIRAVRNTTCFPRATIAIAAGRRAIPIAYDYPITRP